MATKKKIAPAAVVVDASELEQSPPAAKPSKAKEVHTVVRRWHEEVDLDDEAATAAAAEIEEFEETDPIALAMDDIGMPGDTWTLQVYELRDYEKLRNAAPNFRTFRGSIMIPTPEYIPNEEYLEEMQMRWVRSGPPVYFYLAVKRGNHFHPKNLPVVCVAPLDPVTLAKQNANGQAAAQVPMVGYPYPVPQDPNQDPLKSLVSTARQIKSLMELFQPNANGGGYSAPPPPANESTPGNNLTNALMTVAAANPDVLDEMTTRVGRIFRGNGGAHETNFWDIALAFTQNFHPTEIIDRVRLLAAEIRGTAPAAAPPPAALNPAPPPVIPPQQAPQADQFAVPPGQPAEGYLINFLLNACEQSQTWQPHLAAQWIAQFEQRNPSVTAYLDQALAMEPSACLALLKSAYPAAARIIDMPHSLTWLTDVFNALEPKDDGEPPVFIPSSSVAAGAPVELPFVTGG